MAYGLDHERYLMRKNYINGNITSVRGKKIKKIEFNLKSVNNTTPSSSPCAEPICHLWMKPQQQHVRIKSRTFNYCLLLLLTQKQTTLSNQCKWNPERISITTPEIQEDCNSKPRGSSGGTSPVDCRFLPPPPIDLKWNISAAALGWDPKAWCNVLLLSWMSGLLTSVTFHSFALL